MGVGVDEEADEQVGQGGQVRASGKKSPDLAWARKTSNHFCLGRMLSSHAAVGHHVIHGRRGGRRGDEGRRGGGGEVDEEMDGCTGSTNNELGDLERGEGALKDTGHTDVERRECIVGVLFHLLARLGIMVGEIAGNYHKSMDEGIKNAEDPDGRRHKTI